MANPSVNGGTNGHGSGGKFLPGNKVGRGDPFIAQRQKFRSQFVKAAESRFPKIAKKLLELAAKGEEWAIKEVLDRCLGIVKEDAPVPVAPVLNQQNNYFATLTPEQQARIDELAKVGLAKLGAEDEDDESETT